MRYIKLGNSQLELSVISFGAWAIGGWMWGGNEQNDAIESIRASYDEGITSIDTAPVYGQGESEEIVGRAIKGLPRDKVQILTKYGMRWDQTKGDFAFKSMNNQGQPIDIYKYASKESIVWEVEQSLKRLGTDYIDLYQIHWPDSTTPIQETMEAVDQLIRQGKIRYAGVCNYNETQLAEAVKYIPLVSNQVPYSMVKRGIEEKVVPFCLENNLSILAYSPMERGLLTGKIKPGHAFAEGDHRAKLPFFKDENLVLVNRFLEEIKPIANQKEVSLSHLVLAWTLHRPGITVALAGARNAEQARSNAKAADIHLSEEESGFITAKLDQLKLIL